MAFNPESTPGPSKESSEQNESQEQLQKEVFLWASDVTLKGENIPDTWYHWDGRVVWEKQQKKWQSRSAESKSKKIEELALELANAMEAIPRQELQQQYGQPIKYRLNMFPSEMIKERYGDLQEGNIKSRVIRSLSPDEADAFMTEYKKHRKPISGA